MTRELAFLLREGVHSIRVLINDCIDNDVDNKEALELINAEVDKFSVNVIGANLDIIYDAEQEAEDDENSLDGDDES